MNFIKIYALLICMLLSSYVALGQSADVKTEFESRLWEASSVNKTIVARFTQQKSVPGIKNDIESVGDFYYDNSGSMAMIYDSPEGDKVVMNGDNFTIIVGGKRIVSGSENPMMAQISYMMQASMSGDVQKLGRGWELTIELEQEGYRVVVSPNERRVKRYITSMTMLFDAQTLTLSSLRIDEQSGGFTTYTFLEKEINRDIDNEIFIP